MYIETVLAVDLPFMTSLYNWLLPLQRLVILRKKRTVIANEAENQKRKNLPFEHHTLNKYDIRNPNYGKLSSYQKSQLKMIQESYDVEAIKEQNKYLFSE